MITRFKKKLRLAGLEDRIQSELGLSTAASGWLCRLAQDCAQQNGLDLLSVRADVIADAVFWQLERGGHSALLDQLAEENPLFANRLISYRNSRSSKAA